MKLYYKIENDHKIFYIGLSIVLGEWRISNPTEELLLEAGWMIYVPTVPPEPTLEELLQLAKDSKIAEIEDYDNSTNVNECYINYNGLTISYWGDKKDRASLQKAVEDYISLNILTYRLDLREYNISINIPCENMLDMLLKLEVYATLCYNKTSDHIYAVKALSTVEAVEQYDYTVGYPEKLTFAL